MRSILLLFFLLPTLPVIAQDEPPAREAALLFRLGYGYQLPGGALADRFGGNFSVDGGLDLLLREQDWVFSVEGQFLFGSEVKADVLAPLRTPEGYIYAADQSPADIRLSGRGFYVGAAAGRLIPLSAVNPRSALRLSLGGGLLQHKIRIQDDPFHFVPQLSAEYKKGYDRLSNGPALRQFIGYQLLNPGGGLHFYAGIDLLQGFTRSRRDFNFDTQQADDRARLDLLFGLRAGWILPFYLRKASEIYY
jgi:hypothetical protein